VDPLLGSVRDELIPLIQFLKQYLLAVIPVELLEVHLGNTLNDHWARATILVFLLKRKIIIKVLKPCGSSWFHPHVMLLALRLRVARR